MLRIYGVYREQSTGEVINWNQFGRRPLPFGKTAKKPGGGGPGKVLEGEKLSAGKLKPQSAVLQDRPPVTRDAVAQATRVRQLKANKFSYVCKCL